MDEELLALIEDWRRTSGEIPSRSEAIRELLRKALKSEGIS